MEQLTDHLMVVGVLLPRRRPLLLMHLGPHLAHSGTQSIGTGTHSRSVSASDIPTTEDRSTS